jgi:hypothetical protein
MSDIIYSVEVTAILVVLKEQWPIAEIKLRYALTSLQDKLAASRVEPKGEITDMDIVVGLPIEAPSAPREFWVAESTPYTDDRCISKASADMLFGGDDFWKSEYIHVIEYSAWEALQRELDKAKHLVEVSWTRDAINKLQSDLDAKEQINQRQYEISMEDFSNLEKLRTELAEAKADLETIRSYEKSELGKSHALAKDNGQKEPALKCAINPSDSQCAGEREE